eukprot:6635312-Heterocapsa_arctica.AAC.1
MSLAAAVAAGASVISWAISPSSSSSSTAVRGMGFPSCVAASPWTLPSSVSWALSLGPPFGPARLTDSDTGVGIMPLIASELPILASR